MQLVLFDIDETLIHCDRHDTKKFHYATKKVYGVEGKKIITHGMTDQQIIIEILKNEGFSEIAAKSKIADTKTRKLPLVANSLTAK